jgi:hypothetical protein
VRARVACFVILAIALVAAACSVALPSGSAVAQPSMPVVAMSPSQSPTASVVPSPDPTDDPGDDASPPPVTPLPGCGTGEGAFRELAPAISRVLRFGGAPIELTTAAVAMRDGSYVADDAIPGFLGLAADEHAVAASPHGTVRLSGQSGMRLTGAQVGVYRWRDISFRANSLPDVSGGPTGGSAKSDGKGGILVAAPPRGEYALELTVQWTTDCLQGDGVAYARVVVR